MLTLKNDSKEIGGIKFTTTQFPAMRAFRLLARLLKTIGPTLGALTKLDPNAQIDLAGEELASAFASLDPNEAAALLPEILNATTAIVDGKEYPLLKEEHINNVFSGKLGVLFQVLGFALQLNYGSFSVEGAPAALTASA